MVTYPEMLKQTKNTKAEILRSLQVSKVHNTDVKYLRSNLKVILLSKGALLTYVISSYALEMELLFSSRDIEHAVLKTSFCHLCL